MENKQLIAIVKSPAKDRHLREGNGFSLAEIKNAGKTVEEIKKFNIKIDYFRKSIHKENVESLKNLKSSKKKGKAREPFVAKEKKRTPFKPKIEKIKKTAPKKPTPKKKVEKEVKPTKTKKEAKKPALEPAKLKKDEKIKIALTELVGMGPATSEKFKQIGVNDVEELLNEDPKELAALIKGVSEERIKNWIDEGKKLLDK
jgi:hypothetical protein